MTPARLADCLATLHWSRRALAARIGRDEAIVRAWSRGDRAPPDALADWLDGLARLVEAYPPPPPVPPYARSDAPRGLL